MVYIICSNGDRMTPRQLKKFRRRFRLPYDSFKELLKDLETHPLFSQWKDGNKNCAGKLASPLPLLLLATLRYLGRGWCFDDCEEQTCISEETHCFFFHKFIEYGSTSLSVKKHDKKITGYVYKTSSHF